MSKQRIRLSDIAEEANTSVMSVSHVLNGSGQGKVSVGPELAARIRKVAKHLKYRPHQAARALRGSSIKVIGAITYGDMDPVNTRALAYLGTEMSQHGYHLMSSRLPQESDDWQETIVAMLSHGVNALFAFCNHDSALKQALQLGEDEGVPVIPIRVDGSPLPDKTQGIEISLKKGIQLAIDQFDHRSKIRIVSDIPLPAWEKTVNELGHHLESSSSRCIAQANEQILCSNDLLAAKIIRHSSPLRPGIDYKIIGWGNAPACEYMTPKLSSIGLNLPEAVAAAAKCIIYQHPSQLHQITPLYIGRETS